MKRKPSPPALCTCGHTVPSDDAHRSPNGTTTCIACLPPAMTVAEFAVEMAKTGGWFGREAKEKAT